MSGEGSYTDSAEGSSSAEFNREDFVEKELYKVDIDMLKKEIEGLKKLLEDTKFQVIDQSKNNDELLKEEFKQTIAEQDDLINATKEDLVLSHKKLAKERSDFQVQFNDLK